MMNPEAQHELQRLLSALCDGQLAEEQRGRLEELLAADPDCRRAYLEYIDLHARLLMHPQVSSEPLPVVSGIASQRTRVAAAPPTPRRRLPQLLRYGLVAGGTLAASLLIQVLWWPPQGGSRDHAKGPTSSPMPPPVSAYVGTLTHAVDCAWENPAEPLREGARLLPGEVRLERGIIRIRFDSGAELVVEGPAALSLSSSTAATVLRGKVVFHADKTTAPFDLHTPRATLADFGTEFAVAVGPEGEEVHVFDGEVQRTPKTLARASEPEYLKAGEARRYGPSPAAPGQPTELNPERFVRHVSPQADPTTGLLAYDGFDYQDWGVFQAGRAQGGIGWAGPWTPGFARPLNPGDVRQQVLNLKEGLSRPGAAAAPVGGCFDYAGFTKYFRRLAVPIRMDGDQVYYLSFLFRREGPADHQVNAVAVLLWPDADVPEQKDADARRRLNVGVRGWNQLFTQLHDVGSRVPLPLHYGETYLLVAKITTSSLNLDQVFMRVYGPDEPIEVEEPGTWSVVGQPFHSELTFDWLQLHINSNRRQMIDEVRLGTTWAAVTGPWLKRPETPKENKPH
jgi:ferric-dicitrate binding protein FerR (iron transport regulator)